MDFLFITRCFDDKNIQTIKDNIKETFNYRKDCYLHCLICDLTHGANKEIFNKFKDDKTDVFFVENKKDGDKYCSEALDAVVNKYNDDVWVYVLDDDNILRYNFLKTKKYCKDSELVIFDAERNDEFTWLCRPRGLTENNCIGQIDFSNMLIKNSLAKRIGFYSKDSFSCDGEFMVNVLKNNIKFIQIPKVFAFYNKLKEIKK